MKKIVICAIAAFAAMSATSCSDSLDRSPKTEVTAKDFFKTASHLETYTNGLYLDQLATVPNDDTGSDNVTMNTWAYDFLSMINSDGISPDNVGGWNESTWKKLRRINYMLDNIDPAKMTIAEADLNHYVGIARFFRAMWYYNMVKKYSALPIYTKAMGATDESLYKASDSREAVVDFVIEDLQFAAKNVKTGLGQRTRVNRYAALALLSRVALHEGTFRKYHKELALQSSADKFLKIAESASQEIVDSKLFEIYGSSVSDYTALFTSSKLRENREIIMAVEYDQALGRGNNTHVVLGEYFGLTNSLMKAYQMSDGSEYSELKADGTRKSYVEMFDNRDPRFAATFAYPGFKKSPENSEDAPYRPNIVYGGMMQLKFYPLITSQRQGWDRDYTSLPIFRYAETLLIIAEAKAELGNITQGDLDRTVNLIRTRVSMPAIKLSADIKNVIRRERRVELACEGFRLDDLKRWAQSDVLSAQPEGLYIAELGAFDVTGDGVADIALLAKEGDEQAIPEDVRKTLLINFLADKDGKPTSIYLDGADGKSGYVKFVTNKKRAWQDKYYYTPIPKHQLLLNPNLVQSPGWEK